MSHPQTHRLFTPQRMKVVADVIVALDLALLILIWLPGAIYLIYNLDTACFGIEFIIHFIILLHFALGMAIAWVSSQIDNEEEEYREKFYEHFMNGPSPMKGNPVPPPLQYVSYRVYSPLAWIFTSLISLVGDSVLLAAAVRTFRLGVADECRDARITHLAYDTVALALSLASIIWFVLFAIYVIAPQRHSERMAATRAHVASTMAHRVAAQQQQHTAPLNRLQLQQQYPNTRYRPPNSSARATAKMNV